MQDLSNEELYHIKEAEKVVVKCRQTEFQRFLNIARSIDEATSFAILKNVSKYVLDNHIPYNKSWFWKWLSVTLRSYLIKYLNKDWCNLRNQFRTYEETQEVLIIRKNYWGSRKALKIKGEIEDSIITLARDGRNYSASQVARKILEMYGDKAPKRRAVTRFMQQSKTQFITADKYGYNSRFNQNFRSYVTVENAKHAGDCWEMDGTRSNIIDHKTTVSKDGKQVTVSEFLYKIVVRDVMSGRVLGWNFCHTESAAAYIAALEMAVKNAGHLPYELVYDRFPGHTSAEWKFVEYNLGRKNVILTVSHKAEGKARIERFIKTLQQVFMVESDYYYGEGIRSSYRHAHRSAEYLAKIHKKAAKEGFNFSDACNEIARCLEKYNNTELSRYSRKYRKVDKSPLQLYQQDTHDNAISILDNEFCYIFGLRKSLKINHNKIVTEINGITHEYLIDDPKIIENYNQEHLTCAFDFDDLSRVHIYAEGVYLTTLDKISAARRYGRVEDRDLRSVGRIAKSTREIEQLRQQRLGEIGNTAAGIKVVHSAGTVAVNPELGILRGNKISKDEAQAAETGVYAEAHDIDIEKYTISQY